MEIYHLEFSELAKVINHIVYVYIFIRILEKHIYCNFVFIAF